MLSGDAHHSLMSEVEPRIWFVAGCQRRAILNERATILNRKIQLGHRVCENLWPNRLPGDELIRQHDGHGNAFDRVRQERLRSRVLVYIDNDGAFAIGPTR